MPRKAAALLVAVLATTALSATALAAASAPVAAATTCAHGSRRQHARAERLRSIGRPDRLMVGWNRDRGGRAVYTLVPYSPHSRKESGKKRRL